MESNLGLLMRFPNQGCFQPHCQSPVHMQCRARFNEVPPWAFPQATVKTHRGELSCSRAILSQANSRLAPQALKDFSGCSHPEHHPSCCYPQPRHPEASSHRAASLTAGGRWGVASRTGSLSLGWKGKVTGRSLAPVEPLSPLLQPKTDPSPKGSVLPLTASRLLVLEHSASPSAWAVTPHK